jgi:DNA-binding MarR family transcriptional regulator
MRTELAKETRRAWRAVYEAHALILRRIDADLSAADVVSLVEYDVLFVLYDAPGRRRRLSELADAVFISRSGLTRLLDRLESRGLLRREDDPTDRRGVYAVLTDAGLEEMRRCWSVYSRGIAAYFGQHLSAEETQVVASAFGRAREALGR